MSRSKRKTKIFGNCGGSDKYFKAKSNRKLRRLLKENLDLEDTFAVNKREYSDIYSSKKDGKHYFAEATKKDMFK